MNAIARASLTPSRNDSAAGQFGRSRRRNKFPHAIHRQRGAIGLFGVFVLLLALLFTALTVDTGRLWLQKRATQAIADLAALDAARSLNCGSAISSVMDAAQVSAERNGFTGDLSLSPNLVELGGLTSVSGMHQFNPGTGHEAVHVVATQRVPASLIVGGLWGENIVIEAEATARAEPDQATFSAGSYLLRLSTTAQDANLINALLGGLLGSSLSLDALSYKGLASTNINLLQLVKASVSAATVEELLSTELSVAQVVGLVIDAVSQQGADNVEVIAGLQKMLTAAQGFNGQKIHLADVLSVATPSSEAAANVGINALDLLTTSILLATKNSAVDLPLSVNVGALANIIASVKVIEPPQIAVGPAGRNADGKWCTQARTAQVTVKAKVQVTVPAIASIDLALSVVLAQGEAHLTVLDLSPGTTTAVIDATPGIAAINLTNSAGTGPASVSLVLLPIKIATIGLNLSLQQGSTVPLTFEVATPVAGHLPAQKSASSSLGNTLATALANSDIIQVTVLNALALGPILNAVINTVLSPLLGFIGSALLDPLLRLLGLQVGGLDVTLIDVVYNGGAQLVH